MQMKNCQNGTFEPVHEIQNFFWPKAFFRSIMKMAIRKFFHNMSQGLPNPGFMQEKVHKGDFLWCPMMKKNFNPFFRFYTSWFLLELAMALVTTIGMRFLQVWTLNKLQKSMGETELFHEFTPSTYFDLKNLSLVLHMVLPVHNYLELLVHP